MDDSRVNEINWADFFEYGPERSRLLIAAWRKLALGRPIEPRWIEEAGSAVGMDAGEAREFLHSVSERDARGRLTGVLTLSLNDHPHRFIVDGRRLSAWCAIDTLFLPAMLGVSANVESKSPISHSPIRLEVAPGGPVAVTPATTVVTVPILTADEMDTTSTERIWSALCHRIYFFVEQAEAEEWVADRGEFEIVSVEAAWRLGMETWAGVLPYAREAATAA